MAPHTDTRYHLPNMPPLSQPTDSTPNRLDFRPLSDVMAAEVIGLDLSRPLDAATRDDLFESFLCHQLLVFRDQKLTKDQQVTFTEQFGTLERHTLRNRGSSDHPFVHVVSNLGEDGKPNGKVASTLWHSDKSFRAEPAMASVLHAKQLPPGGGDTVFANLYAAYDALPDADKTELDGVMTIHSYALSREHAGRTISPQEIADAPPMAHPLVRVHPDTEKKALFLGMHASHFEGADFDTGRARILSLEDHSTAPQFTYRHTWREGDLLMWDNRCLIHRLDPNFDTLEHPRVMHRTCLRGTPTG